MNSSTKVKILYISLLLFFVANFQVFANFQQKDAAEVCNNFHMAGQKENEKGNYIKAIECYTKAELIAKENQLNDQLVQIKCSMGVAYSNISNYGEAMTCYIEGLEIIEGNPKIKELSLRLLSNIGVLYVAEENYKEALEYFLKGYSVAKEIKSPIGQLFLGINISDVYNKLGDFEKARYYLNDIKDIPKEERFVQFWNVNYAETFFVEGKVKKAQKIMEGIFQSVDRKNTNSCYVCVVELLSKIYERQNNIDLAISFAKKGLDNTQELRHRINLYDQLSGLYLRNQQYNTSLQYKDSIILAKDSLSALVNRGLFETNKMKLKIKDYESEAKNNKEKREKYESERKLFIIGILFSLLLFFFIYRGLKNRIIKQKQEKIIAENQQKIVSLEMEGLKNNMAEKNRSLSAKALYLSSRNELIEEIINALSQMPQITRNKEVSDYMKTLKSYLKTEEEWDDFISYFEEVNPEFLKKITLKHPDVSTSDLRFICYVYMNLDTREIGNIFNITYNAARKRKIRIKEKMGIDNDDSLYEYLLTISNS
ncbi:Tetratricopeptide repeat protein [compost metagenome]